MIDTDILLSTYNGEKYLRQQIESIIAQDYTDWRLLIRDDGSKDGTLDIINGYCQQYPGKIELLQDGKGNVGCTKSFEALMYASDAPYLMFCDQDDVWLHDKVGKTVSAVKQAEKDGHLPVIAHCDQKVVDADLNVLDESFINYSQTNVDLYKKNPLFMVISNYIPGCTICMNNIAKQISLPIGQSALMHDWWIILKTIDNGGKIIDIQEPLMLYRQHGINVCGATHEKFNCAYYLRKTRKIKDMVGINKKLFKQAKEAINLNLLTYLMIRIRIFWKYRYRISMK